MNQLWNLLTRKFTGGLFFAIIVILEIRQGFLKEFKAYWGSLKRGYYLAVLALASLAVLVLLPLDEPVIEKVQTIQASWAIQLIQFGSLWGKSGYLWGLLALLYFAFSFFPQFPALAGRGQGEGKSLPLKYLAFGALISSGLTSLTVHIIKYIFVRARPLMDMGPYHFFDYKGFLEHGSKFLSFSSGDVANSAGAMTFLFLWISARGGKNPVRFLFPSIAFLTCISRMYLDKHWPSDAAFSFILSFGFAKFVMDYLEFRKRGSEI